MILDKQKLIQLIRNKLSFYYMETGRNISYEKAGSEMGITKATLSRVLKGNEFEVGTLFKIITWLEIDFYEVSTLTQGELKILAEKFKHLPSDILND